MEKPVDNVEKCDGIIIFSFFPQEILRRKIACSGCITDIIMELPGGYVAMFLLLVSRSILAKKLANLLNGGK